VTDTALVTGDTLRAVDPANGGTGKAGRRMIVAVEGIEACPTDPINRRNRPAPPIATWQIGHTSVDLSATLKNLVDDFRPVS
jgi:hypothetical protein